MTNEPDLVRGKTLRWTFVDGPTKGATYEHRFDENGVVHFRSVDSASPTASKTAGEQAESKAHYASATIAEGVCAVSYRGDSGFTLTTVLNFQDKRIVGFASNTDHWFAQEGTFEVVSVAQG